MRQPEDGSPENGSPEHTKQEFVYPVINLRSDRVELRPIIPEVHYKKLAAVYRNHPEMSRYMNYPDGSDEAVLGILRKGALAKDSLRHAIYTSPVGTPPNNDVLLEEYQYAGMATFQAVRPDDLAAEIGTLVFPEFQRSHVATHAVGLLCHRLLDLPPASSSSTQREYEFPGLGMRRIEWRANSANAPSLSLALRMGFTHEGTLRNTGVMDEGKIGDGKGRSGDAKYPRISEGTWIGSITGEDWDEGARDIVERQMARTS